MKIIVINGPNLNMLGIRERNLYGDGTYEELKQRIQEVCDAEGVEVEIFQSNGEGALVDKIQEAYGKAEAIVINPAAYTHTSVAILDALKAVNLPAVEVHLTDINHREDFRRISYPGMYCEKTIVGRGFDGYIEAILYLRDKLKK